MSRYMYIAAKSPEDGRVYRAKTLNNDRDMPQLVYVDYGNEVSLTLILLKFWKDVHTSQPYSETSVN